MTVTLLPDAELIVAQFLLDDPDVSALVADRVFTVSTIKGAAYPCARVLRWGGLPPVQWAYLLDAATLQIDVWADRRAQARLVAETMRAKLVTGLGDAQHVKNVVLGAMADQPDVTDLSDKGHPRPHIRFDLTITTRVPRGG